MKYKNSYQEWKKRHTQEIGQEVTARITASATYNEMSETAQNLLFCCKVLFQNRTSFVFPRDCTIHGFPGDCSPFFREIVAAGFLDYKRDTRTGIIYYSFSERWKGGGTWDRIKKPVSRIGSL